jgi:hypothetical protein
MDLHKHHRVGCQAAAFTMLAVAVSFFFASMVIGSAAGQADAASGGGGDEVRPEGLRLRELFVPRA